jgi:ABC-2 family transporter protein
MSTYTHTPAHSRAAHAFGPRRGSARTSGLIWLVWRQHRAAYWTLIAVTVVAALAIVYLRGQMMDYLDSQGWPTLKSDWESGFQPYGERMADFGGYLVFVPILIGVFVGAPLFAGDLETGTAKLVASQSVSRARWLAVKLGLTAAVVAAATALLSALFRWWWEPAKLSGVLSFTGLIFETTGIVPVALALLSFVGGAAVGLVLRRTLVSMVVTFGAVVALKFVWDHFHQSLGRVHTLATRDGVGSADAYPKLPAGAQQIGSGTDFLTNSGQRLDWTTCVDTSADEKAHTACLQAKGVVGYAMDYLPISELPRMQWQGAAVLFALAAATVLFVFLWGRRLSV